MMYCSELVYESFRDADGNPIFPARPMNFRAADGTMPEYWRKSFDSIGIAVPQGIPGTNPNDMIRHAGLIRLPDNVWQKRYHAGHKRK